MRLRQQKNVRLCATSGGSTPHLSIPGLPQQAEVRARASGEADGDRLSAVPHAPVWRKWHRLRCRSSP